MAKRKRRRARSANLSWAVAALTCFLGPFHASGEPRVYLFSDMEVSREIAPMFPIDLETADSGKGRRLEDKDTLERSKKRWRVVREIWKSPAGAPGGATVTAIYELVESGGLGFSFLSDASGSCFFEIETPRASNLGPLTVRVGRMKAGVLDLWAPKEEPLGWRQFPEPVTVDAGENRFDLIQLSPTDSPIYLRGFRLIPNPVR